MWSPSSACPSAGLAGFWGSIGPRSARFPRRRDDEAALDRRHHRACHASMAAMAIAGSRRCCAGRLGGEQQAGRADLATGGAESPAETTQDAAGSGSTTARASVCGRSGPTMSGPTTSSRTAPMMEGSSACSASSTSSPANAWPSGSSESSTQPTSSTSLCDLFILRGVPGHIRSDNGPEFIAEALRDWIAAVGARTAYIEPRQPLGEWLLRELQLEAPRRAAQRRNLLHAEGSQDRHRRLAAPLQHGPAALVARLQAARPGGRAMAGFATRTSFAGHPSRGAKARHALTFKSDHLSGAGPRANGKFLTQSGRSKIRLLIQCAQ